ncbi:MAG: hypothetical protein KAI18_03630 [Candidatus Aenigmarchaeota archaeon]|nr:hypothetical protein [Candidatus Aenigmarchaeota archaeon]
MSYEEPCTNPFCNFTIGCGSLTHKYCDGYRPPIISDDGIQENMITVLKQVEIIKNL